MINKGDMKSSNGSYRIADLFVETSRNRSRAVFSLSNPPQEGYIDIRRAYLNMNDVTEYTFADTYFLDYDHWLAIAASVSLGPYVEKWREELEIKVRSKALLDLQASSREGNASAAKYLADGKWKTTAAPGRPKNKTTTAPDHSSEIEKDQERLKGLHH